MYESPIEKVVGEIQSQIIKQDDENLMYAVKQAAGYLVDKNELIKALKYDREQYEKGYRDGLNADKWIPVSERLPKEETNPITHDFYEYQCTYHAHGVYDVRSYKYGNGHWWHGAGIMDDHVLAWRENLEPYRAESEVQDADSY